jgi:nucleoside 2-deoxyribosyltransferase
MARLISYAGLIEAGIFFPQIFLKEYVMKFNKIYLAAGLFTAGEQVHNLLLAKALKELGWFVIVPQVEARKNITSSGKNLKSTIAECYRYATDPNTIVVANLDGPDADSGTVAEIMCGIHRSGFSVLYRTDIRTDFTTEVGVNAMFHYLRPGIIYTPFDLVSLEDITEKYAELARQINDTIISLKT